MLLEHLIDVLVTGKLTIFFSITLIVTESILIGLFQVVRCEESRSVEQNRIKAKDKLLAAVDDHLNKDDSVSAQVKRIEKIRKERKDAKRKQKREEKLKAKLGKEGLNEEDNPDSSQSENSSSEENPETSLKVEEEKKP